MLFTNSSRLLAIAAYFARGIISSSSPAMAISEYSGKVRGNEEEFSTTRLISF